MNSVLKKIASVMADSGDFPSSLFAKLAAVVQEKEIRIKLDNLPEELSGVEKVNISQGFISKTDNADVRIRAWTKGEEDTVYTLTAKYRPDFQEAEMEISKEMFEALAPVATSMQTKHRFQWNGWDIDEIIKDDNGKEGEIWAEYELQGDNLPEIPASWGVNQSVESLVQELDQSAKEAEQKGQTKLAALIDSIANELGL